jgi:ketosteroid isomerase-like protein
VEIVRRGWDAWVRGDLPGVFREYDSEVVWDLSHYRDSVESGYRGTGILDLFDVLGPFLQRVEAEYLERSRKAEFKPGSGKKVGGDG